MLDTYADVAAFKHPEFALLDKMSSIPPVANTLSHGPQNPLMRPLSKLQKSYTDKEVDDEYEDIHQGVPTMSSRNITESHTHSKIH